MSTTVRSAVTRAVVIVALGSSILPAQSINTTPPGVFTSSGLSVGGSSMTVVIGQTFTAPVIDAGSTLQLLDFSFLLRRAAAGGGTAATFRAVLQGISGTTLTGSPLFVSGLRTGPEASGVFTPYTFDAGGLTLESGATYFAYLEVPGGPVSTHTYIVLNPGGAFPNLPVDYYAGGRVLAGRSVGALAQPFGQSDLSFTANFATISSVPEPATVALLGGGLLSLAGLSAVRRRRQG